MDRSSAPEKAHIEIKASAHNIHERVVDECVNPNARGAPKPLISGDHDLFGDGSVVMIALPGHTAGNHGLFVRLRKHGNVLISGDAVHSPEQLTSHAFPPSNVSRADSLRSIDRIVGILRDTQRVSWPSMTRAL